MLCLVKILQAGENEFCLSFPQESLWLIRIQVKSIDLYFMVLCCAILCCAILCCAILFCAINPFGVEIDVQDNKEEKIGEE